MVSGMVDTDETRAERVAGRDASYVAAGSTLAPATTVRQAAGRWTATVRWRPQTVALPLLLYAPAAAILLAGALAALGLLGNLWRLMHAFSTHALTNVPDTYDRLALAARVALVSGAYLALLSALVIVAVGCRGRGWWRLYLIPGVPLSAVAALLFIFAVEWCAAGFNQRLGWPSAVWGTLTTLALGDVVLVAARIGGVGAGPLGTRRARLRGRLRPGRAPELPPERPSRQTRPIPVVRFGPRDTGVPVLESAEQEPQIEARAPDAPRWDRAPTAEELSAASEAAPNAHDRQDSDAAPAAGAA